MSSCSPSTRLRKLDTVSATATTSPGRAGELLGDVERLAQEALDLAGAVDLELVLVGELVDAEDGDDVLQLLVALQHLLDVGRRPVVLLAEDVGLEDRRRRVERVDRRVDALLGDRPGQRRGRVQVGEHRRRGRVGEVVRGDVDGLDRGDRSLRRRRDPLLQLTHLGLQRRLVTDGGRHAAEQRRYLGARLDEPEDVVDEQEHVLAADLTEVLRHRQTGQGDAKTRPGGLVHLAEHHHRLVDDAGLGHLDVEVVALAGPLADAAEGREAAVLGRDVVDQLLDQNGLADAGAAEQADLAALGVRGEEVDDLDAGLEDLLGRGQVLGARGGTVDRPAILALDRRALVDRLAEQVEDPAERVLADGHGDRGAGVDDGVAAAQAVGGVHRDRADAVVAEVLLDLEREVERVATVALGDLDLEGRVDLGQAVREDDVDDDADHLLDRALVGPIRVFSH